MAGKASYNSMVVFLALLMAVAWRVVVIINWALLVKVIVTVGFLLGCELLQPCSIEFSLSPNGKPLCIVD